MSFIVHAFPGMSIQTVIQNLKLKVRDELSDSLKTYINLLKNDQTVPETLIQQKMYVDNVFTYIQKDYEHWSWNMTIMRFQLELLTAKNIKIKVLTICNLLDQCKVSLVGVEKQKEQAYMNHHDLGRRLKQAYLGSL